jgi:hypothetical protein
MTRSRDTLCFTCGQALQDPPRFNLLESGEYCPACRDRVLDAVPAVLPRRFAAQPESAAYEAQMDFGFDEPDDPSERPEPPRRA